MTSRSARAALVLTVSLAAGATAAHPATESNWPALAGADGRGVSSETGLPDTWGPTDNVLWKSPLPGRGHSSPIVWEDRIFLTAAIKGDEIPGHDAVEHLIGDQVFLHPDSVDATYSHQYRVIALDAGSGEMLWNSLAHEGAPYDNRHKASSFASPTAVTDGTLVYAYFGSPGVFAYDFEGNLAWTTDIGDIGTLGMGVGTSPVLHEGVLIIQADAELGEASFIVGLDAATGEQVWKTERPVQASWTTPLLMEYDGGMQVVTGGNEWLIAYDPADGSEIWRIEGLQSNAIHRPLVHDDLVILTAGYPQKIIKTVRLGGTGDLTGSDRLVWAYNKGTGYVPSNLAYDGAVYTLADNGTMTSLDAETGDVIYEGGRIPVAQRFIASPIAFDGKILLSGMDGEVFVIRAGPEFEVVATNSMGEGIYATPAIANGRLYIRTTESLWAIGSD